VVGETKIVITAKADDLVAINDHVCLLGRFADAARAVEVVCFARLEFGAKVFQCRVTHYSLSRKIIETKGETTEAQSTQRKAAML
jgi:hypothetical protein